MVSNSSRDNRKNLILEVATAVIKESGVEALTISEIAHHLQLSRPAIYQYFHSREHILAELLINEMSDLANAIDERMSGCVNPIECIERWVDEMIAFYSSPQHAFIKDISVAQLPESSRGIIMALHGQFMTSLINPLAQLPGEEATVRCGYIFALVVEGAKNVLSGKNPDEVRDHIMHFVRVSAH